MRFSRASAVVAERKSVTSCLPELPILGERDTDHQPGDPTIPGHEAPGDLLGAERDSPDSFQVVVVEGYGIVDKRLDDQLVLAAFAVRVVRDGIDPGDVWRLPQRLGQLFNRDEPFPREDRAVLRRHGDQRRIGESVGVFELFKRDDVRVGRAEVIPDVDVDFDEVPQTRGEGEHGQHREQNGQPSAARHERNAGLEAHVGIPPCARISGMASPTHSPGRGPSPTAHRVSPSQEAVSRRSVPRPRSPDDTTVATNGSACSRARGRPPGRARRHPPETVRFESCGERGERRVPRLAVVLRGFGRPVPGDGDTRYHCGAFPGGRAAPLIAPGFRIRQESSHGQPGAQRAAHPRRPGPAGGRGAAPILAAGRPRRGARTANGRWCR